MKKLRITIGQNSYEVTVEELSDNALQHPLSKTAPPTPATVGLPAISAPVESKHPIAAGSIISPMAGQVFSIPVKVGDKVQEGQALLVLEAMKMKNRITAPAAGIVTNVNVTEGERVAEGHVLLKLE